MRATVILLLGVLLVSPASATFCEGNYVVEAGDWSTIEITDGCDTVTGHTYNWRDSKSSRSNRARMADPTRFGMPEGTPLHSFPVWGVSWIAVCDVRYAYTVVADGITFTNNTSAMSYRACWLSTPCRSFSDMNKYVDDVKVETCEDGVLFRVWGHNTDSDGDKHPTYHEKTIPAGNGDVREWETPNCSIRAKLTNSSMMYYILDVDMPRNIFGYRIDAVSDNHEVFYEHNAYMMQRNVTESGKEFFEVVRSPNTDSQEMSVCGANKFIVPYDTNYKINVTVYTPFEQIKMNVSMIYEEREVAVVDKQSTLASFVSLITMTLGIYFLMRGAM